MGRWVKWFVYGFALSCFMGIVSIDISFLIGWLVLDDMFFFMS